MSYNRDDVDKFYDYDIYIPTRTIYIGSVAYTHDDEETSVDFAMAERAIKGLHLLDKKDGNITVLMNNPGGDWYHGMAIYDAIKGCNNHVTIKVSGHAMSMGAVILQAADERVLAPNSSVMIHYGYDGVYNTAKNFQIWAEQSKKLDKVMEDIFLEKIKEKHPKFTRAKLRGMLDPDTILTPTEAIELGLACKIE
jgi:ATP-dependent Clp protease protease subunit